MEASLEALTRARANYLWESEGRPEGRELKHWAQALDELGELKQRIDPVTSAESILAVLGSLNIENMPPEERMAVSTVQVETLEEWLAAYLQPPS